MTYANPDALVDTAWLADRLDDEAVRIIEVDEEVDLYPLAGPRPGGARLMRGRL